MNMEVYMITDWDVTVDTAWEILLTTPRPPPPNMPDKMALMTDRLVLCVRWDMCSVMQPRAHIKTSSSSNRTWVPLVGIWRRCRLNTIDLIEYLER